MRTPFRLLLSFFVLVSLVAGVSACGEEDASSKSVSELLDDTFTGDSSVDSGRLNVTLDLNLKGLENINGPVQAKLTGPFESADKDELPNFDLDLSVGLAGQTLRAGAVSTGDKGFLKLQGVNFNVPDQLFQSFKTAFAAAEKDQESGDDKAPSLSSLGIDPTRWLTGAKKVGEEKVGDADTIHITAGIDAKKLLEDVNKLLGEAARLGVSGQQQLPQGLTAAQITELSQAVTKADFQLFTGKADTVLRRLAVELAINVPASSREAAGGLQSADVKLGLELVDLNEDQSISEPKNLQPFEQLQLALAQLGIGGGPAPAGPTGAQGVVAPEEASQANADAAKRYLDCLDAAQDDAARAQCVAVLTGQ